MHAAFLWCDRARASLAPPSACLLSDARSKHDPRGQHEGSGKSGDHAVAASAGLWFLRLLPPLVGFLAVSVAATVCIEFRSLGFVQWKPED